MRGSPILRTLIVLLVLILAGGGLWMVRTDSRPSVITTDGPAAVPSQLEAPFMLTLSAPASKVRIETAAGPTELVPGSQTVTGLLPISSENPALFLTVTWQDAAATPRFAKLTLEPPGQPTLTRTFDAIGELSDVWEPDLEP